MAEVPSPAKTRRKSTARRLYACRHIAKNLVAAGVADEVLVQVAYAIGKAQPVSVFVNTYGTSKVAMTDSEIADKVTALFDMRPKAIEERLKLRNPIYRETASYGHMVAASPAQSGRSSNRAMRMRK